MHVILGFAEARWSKLRKGYLWLNFDAFFIPLNVVQTKTPSVYAVCIHHLETFVYPIEQWELPFYVMVAVATKFQVEENVYPTSQQNKLKELFFISTISWKC